MLAVQRVNLNEVSHTAAIELIRQTIAEGINVAEVYIDTVGDPKKYAAKVQRLFPKVSVVVSKKADSLYPIVSAASIAAKVTRDRVLANWQFQEDSLSASRTFGSGYPGDETTRVWLRDNVDKVFGFPSVVRFSWKPVHVMLDKSGVPVKWAEYEEEAEDAEESGGMAVDEDFSAKAKSNASNTSSSPSSRRKSNSNSKPKQQRLNFSTRFRFFADNNMEVVDDF